MIIGFGGPQRFDHCEFSDGEDDEDFDSVDVDELWG